MRTVNGLVLAVILAFSVPVVVDAQTQPPDTRQAPVERQVERDDRGNWGWLGLLGLAGLFGLMGRERHDYRDDRVSRGTTTSR
jgi:MYXO-CTERM domain-containing protein